MNGNSPLVSIITVCYNAEKTIEKTLVSVTSQDYPNIEYIIIDGLSSDNTLDVVGKFKSSIALMCSEKDQGIFDAMNKGMQKATGEYLWFIHADDQIFANDAL